jgi:hypothetical protein
MARITHTISSGELRWYILVHEEYANLVLTICLLGIFNSPASMVQWRYMFITGESQGRLLLTDAQDFVWG